MHSKEWFEKFMKLQARLIRKMWKKFHKKEEDINAFAIVWIGKNSEIFRKYCEKFQTM